MLAAAQPAAALPGLERVSQAYGDFNDAPYKAVTAYCDEEHHVIGGGAHVMDGDRKRVRLLSMTPVQGGEDGFQVAAEAPNLSRQFEWQVVAYAICADRELLDNNNYFIKSRTITVPSSGVPFAHTTADCPGATVAYSAGAHLYVPRTFGSQTKGRIGLQMVRTSTPLDISRASGREDASGFFGSWQLTSYAVCALRSERDPLASPTRSVFVRGSSQIRGDAGYRSRREAGALLSAK